MAEALVNAAFGPVDFQAEFVAVEEPGGDLFDGGLFDVGGEGGLAGGGGVAGEDVAAGVGDAGLGWLKVES